MLIQTTHVLSGPFHFAFWCICFKATHTPTCSMTSDFFKLCWPLIQKAHSTVLISLLATASAVIWNPQKYFFFLDFNTYWVLSVRHCPRLCVNVRENVVLALKKLRIILKKKKKLSISLFAKQLLIYSMLSVTGSSKFEAKNNLLTSSQNPISPCAVVGSDPKLIKCSTI